MGIKSFQKTASVLSLIFGVLATISVILKVMFILERLMYGLPLFVFLGIIFGIIGLKSTKRNLAIAGIVLSLIPIIYWTGFFLYMRQFI